MPTEDQRLRRNAAALADYHERMKDPAEREKARAAKRASYEKLKTDVIEGYGGKCACCGETERAFLVLDHIDGGGNAHRASFGPKGVTQYVYREVRKMGYPPEFQILCANCNLAKERPDGCPHQR